MTYHLNVGRPSRGCSLREAASRGATKPDHYSVSVGTRCCVAKAFKVLEITSMHLGTSGGKELGACTAASKGERPMAGIDQFSDDCRTNEACGTGDKNTHILTS